eukprot:TRINITY_DN10475_c0_g1_i5.p1 TRINITY_DN10475_c0_g1~~TRINITY_DN10475_c0_g1_i5.p1  ORF type:complete len:582 (-),score=116.34 TRINITY_DN10475_c0_g1_i5:401-2050(-)
MKDASDDMNSEFEKFKEEAEKYRRKQIFKATLGMLFAVGQLALCFATGKPPDISTVMEDIQEILDLIMELEELAITLDGLRDMTESLDLDDLADNDYQIDTNFQNCLNNMVDLKMKTSSFDELQNQATIKFAAMNAATNYEILGCDTMEMALMKVAQLGHEMVDESVRFSDIILRLTQENGNLAVAMKDQKKALEQIESIEKEIKDFNKMMKYFSQDKEKAQAEYEKEIEDMKNHYADITEEMRNEYKKKITASFDSFQATFESLTGKYELKLSDLITSIHQKFYGLKEESMNQRSIILTLYTDYCDAYFYNTLKECDESDIPYMSDSFDVLLRKLKQIQWNSVVAPEEIDGTPQYFDFPFCIDSSDKETLFGGKRNLIIETLRNTSEVSINLKDLDVFNGFNDMWRIRIESMTFILLNEANQPIKSSGTNFGQQIKLQIKYPTSFNDTDAENNNIGFMGQTFFCNADYISDGKDIDQLSECNIQEEFSTKNYKASPDGLYTFKVGNPDMVDLASVSKIALRASGSSIPKQSGIVKLGSVADRKFICGT